MRRVSLSLALAASLVISLVVPASAASPGKPSASMILTAGCSSAVYSWANQKKPATANIEVRPDGVLVETFTVAAGASGSFQIPEYEFIAGQHYTIGGVLRDSSGRSIVQSGAVWWGYC